MTNELIEKAKECKNSEELLLLAKENGINMTAEEAQVKYAELHNEGELSDDELKSAAGGGCGKSPELEVGMTVRWNDKNAKHRAGCSCPGTFVVKGIRNDSRNEWHQILVDISCTECGAFFYDNAPSDLTVV